MRKGGARVKIELLAMAERAIVDRRNGKLSLVDLYSSNEAASYPLLLKNVAIVVFVRRTEAEPRTGVVRIAIMFGESQAIDQGIDFDFVDRMSSLVIIELDALVVPAPGELIVRASLDDSVATYPVVFTLRAEPPRLSVEGANPSPTTGRP